MHRYQSLIYFSDRHQPKIKNKSISTELYHELCRAKNTTSNHHTLTHTQLFNPKKNSACAFQGHST